MNHAEKLLAAMANGRKVTRLTAMFDLEIQNVTARVSDLRDFFWDHGLDKHIDIVTTLRVDEHGRRYAAYSLSEGAVPKLVAKGVLIGDHNDGFRASLSALSGA